MLLYLDQEGRGNGLANKIRAYQLQAQGFDTYDADEVLGFDHDQRHYDFAAAMLKQLGITRVRLMTNNPAKIVGARGGRARSRLGAAHPRPQDRSERPLSRRQARPRRPFDRDRELARA